MKEKVLVLGTGFLGSRIKEEFGCEASGEIIHNFSQADELVKKFNPQVIINAIGYTGQNVDYCEKDVDNTLLANSFVPLMLAEVALRHKIKLVHISSGCIYHYDYAKDNPLEEALVPDFFELFYSRTKIYSEQPLNILAKKYPILVARIRIPLDNRPHPKNLLDKLIKYKQVIDIPNSVTYIPDFLRSLRHLIEIDARGIYNLVNKGGLVYSSLMDIYARHVPEFKYKVINFAKLNLVRTNLILSVKKLEATGFKMPQINEVLEKCVEDFLRYS
jgi:dTDP-4-dehydrorhamnose reductase